MFRYAFRAEYLWFVRVYVCIRLYTLMSRLECEKTIYSKTFFSSTKGNGYKIRFDEKYTFIFSLSEWSRLKRRSRGHVWSYNGSKRPETFYRKNQLSNVHPGGFLHTCPTVLV